MSHRATGPAGRATSESGHWPGGRGHASGEASARSESGSSGPGAPRGVGASGANAAEEAAGRAGTGAGRGGGGFPRPIPPVAPLVRPADHASQPEAPGGRPRPPTPPGPAWTTSCPGQLRPRERVRRRRRSGGPLTAVAGGAGGCPRPTTPAAVEAAWPPPRHSTRMGAPGERPPTPAPRPRKAVGRLPGRRSPRGPLAGPGGTTGHRPVGRGPGSWHQLMLQTRHHRGLRVRADLGGSPPQLRPARPPRRPGPDPGRHGPNR